MKKRAIDYIVAIFIILGLSFCILTDMSFFVMESESEETHSLISEQEDEETKNYALDVPYEWDEIIYENHSICANIDVPEIIREKGYQKATAVQKDNQFENLVPIFKGYELEEDILPDGIVRYKGLNESYLNIYEGCFIFTNIYSIYVGMAYNDITFMDSYNADKYAVETDLDEFSLQECDDKLEEIFEYMQLDSDITVFRRSLDHKTMEQEAVELHHDGSESKPDYTWSISDDCYYCQISQLCNDIPIIPNDSFLYWTNILYDRMHTIVLREDGVVKMVCNEVFEISYEDNYEELVDFSEIMQKYRDSAVDVPKEQRIEITDITLRVRAMKNDEGNYDLLPMWIFYGTQEIDGTWSYPYVVVFDALTGDVVL